MEPKFQTLSEFLRSPFGRQDLELKNQEYERKYTDFLSENRIRLVAYTIIEGSYYMHLKVPSESAKAENYYYDVVIRFFALSKEVESQASLRNYYVQFFSNSPSFIYKYAVLYRKHGALIEFLFDKMNPEYADTLPEKTNQSMEISYDKSIYFAVRYLLDHKFRYLNKLGSLLQKKRSPKVFLAAIRDFETVRLERMLITEEQRLQREHKKFKEKKTKTPATSSKKFAIQDALADNAKPGIRIVSAKKATKSTATGKASIRKATKKTARRTTFH